MKLYTEYLEQEHLNLSSEMKQLELENRLDESIHKKIKLNVVDIFTKMYTISLQQANGERSKLKDSYINYLEKIPANWYINLAKAKEHGDDKTIFTEELKIAQKDQLKDKFLEMV